VPKQHRRALQPSRCRPFALHLGPTNLTGCSSPTDLPRAGERSAERRSWQAGRWTILGFLGNPVKLGTGPARRRHLDRAQCWRYSTVAGTLIPSPIWWPDHPARMNPSERALRPRPLTSDDRHSHLETSQIRACVPCVFVLCLQGPAGGRPPRPACQPSCVRRAVADLRVGSLRARLCS
jgi:hypothetical protein